MLVITLEEKERMLRVIDQFGKGTVGYIKQATSSHKYLNTKGEIKTKYNYKYIPCVITVSERSLEAFRRAGYEIDKVKYGWFDEILPKKFLKELEKESKDRGII
ncbi:hypothetical protein KHQ81_15845 (plasmid) [Mycoplasmatota bacterium]|nr:hypothetical protein KHQ81_15845 [Mycoplasmatota bacterium]